MKRWLADWRFWAALAVLFHIGAGIVGGASGLQGMALGFWGTGLVVGGTGAVVWLLAKGAKDQKPPIWGSLLISVVFVLMLPSFVVSAILVHRIGGMGTSCFLAGMALVYCALIGWAQATR